MAMLIAEREGMDRATAYVEWLKEPMSCGHPRAAVRSSNPNATWDTTCWCAGCAEEAAQANEIKAVLSVAESAAFEEQLGFLQDQNTCLRRALQAVIEFDEGETWSLEHWSQVMYDVRQAVGEAAE